MRLSLDLGLGSVATLNAGVGYTITDTDALAYVARLSSQPSSSRKQAIDNFFIALKAASIFTKFDALYDLMASNEADCLLNLKSTSFSLVKSGTVTFTPNLGAVGNAVDGFLSTQFTPSTAGGQHVKDSASYGVFCNTPNTRSASFLLGTTSSNSRLKRRVVTSNALAGYINDGTADPGSNNSGLLPGLASLSRTGAAVKRGFNNGDRVFDLTTASTALTSQPLWLLRSGTNYSDEQIAFAFIGGGLSDSEMADLWTAVQTYLLAVQRPIFCFGDSLTWGQVGAGVQATAPWPLRLQAALGRLVYNGGVAGETSTAIAARQAFDTYGVNGVTVIEAGRNNFTDPTTVKADVAAMVARCTSGRYIVTGITPFTGDGDLNAANSITRLALNSDLATTYGSRYLDVLPDLQAANDGSANDLSDVASGWIPRSLRYDTGHVHDTANSNGFSGIGVWASSVQAKLASLGY